MGCDPLVKWWQSWGTIDSDDISFEAPPGLLVSAYEEAPHLLVSTGIGVSTRIPSVSAAVLIAHGLYHLTEPYREDSRGGGGPSVQSQTPLTSSKPSPQARASAQGGKAGAPARASQRGSRSGRKSCPKGQYWSFKQKKCVKSKFR